MGLVETGRIEQRKKRRRLTQQSGHLGTKAGKLHRAKARVRAAKEGQPIAQRAELPGRRTEHHFIQSSSQSLSKTHRFIPTAESNPRATDARLRLCWKRIVD